MNKSLLMLLAVAIMGTNLVAKTTTDKKEKKSCWSCCTKKDDTKKSGWCDLKRCDRKEKAEWGCKCHNKEKKETAKKL